MINQISTPFRLFLKNEQVDHVQFVIQTKSIEVDEPDEEEPEKEEKVVLGKI